MGGLIASSRRATRPRGSARGTISSTTPSVESGLMGPQARARSSNIPMGCKGEREEIAHAVLFLSSAAASYVTGQTPTVDGGITL